MSEEKQNINNFSDMKVADDFVAGNKIVNKYELNSDKEITLWLLNEEEEIQNTIKNCENCKEAFKNKKADIEEKIDNADQIILNMKNVIKSTHFGIREFYIDGEIYLRNHKYVVNTRKSLKIFQSELEEIKKKGKYYFVCENHKNLQEKLKDIQAKLNYFK